MNRNQMIALAIVVIVLVASIGVAAYFIIIDDGGDGQKTIYWLSVPPVSQQASLAAGTIQGGVSWEPYCSDSIVGGTAHAVIWSNEVWPGHPCCVVVVKTSFLNSNPDLVARTVRAHIDANNWIVDALANPTSENYTKLMQMGADFSKRNVTVVEAAVEHIGFSYNLTDQVMDGLEMFTSLFAELGQITSLGGFATVEDFVNNLTDTNVLSEAMSVQPSDTILGTVNLGYLAGDLHQFARVVAMNATVFGDKSLYEKYGVNVVPSNPAGYLNGGAVMDAFAAGTVDVGYLGAPPTILKRINAGTNVKIVALANSEGSAILGVDGINSFDDFEGKTIGTPGPSSIQHLLLLSYAKEQGFIVKLKGT